MIPSGEIAQRYTEHLIAIHQRVLDEEDLRMMTNGSPWTVFMGTTIESLTAYFKSVAGRDHDILYLLQNYADLRILLPFSHAIEIREKDVDISSNIKLMVGIATQPFDRLFGLQRVRPLPHPQRQMVYGNAYLRDPWEKAVGLTNGLGFNMIISRPAEPLSKPLFTERSHKRIGQSLSQEQALDLTFGLQYFLNVYNSLSVGGVAYIQLPIFSLENQEVESMLKGLSQMLKPYGVKFTFSIKGVAEGMIVKSKDSPRYIVPANPFAESQRRHGEYRDGQLAIDFNRHIPPERLNPLGCKVCHLHGACRFNGLGRHDDGIMHDIARSPVTGAEYADQTIRTAHGDGFTTQSEVVFGPRGIRTATCSVVRSDGTLGEVIGTYPNEP
ncbi:hypothetical protein KBD45_08165 [Candidatus Dojkabacteria bacterium]|nr:hypothetical protein [Candidatus Dojkabacteria bacterium]